MLGTRIGLYTIVEEVARGGDSVVFRGEQQPGGAAIAVKLVPRRHPRYEELRRRLLEEASAGQRARHPGIVRTLATGEIDAGCYAVQEFLHGQALHRMLRERTSPGRGLALGEAARIGAELAEALAALHALGLVHGDLKPPNAMLCETRVVLCDLGLTAPEGTRRPDGQIWGSPSYIAPELTRGAALARGADLWSLGVVLFEMLAGVRPFGLNTDDPQAIVEAVRTAPLPRLLEDRPPEVRALLDALLDRDPARRLNDAAEAARRLRAFTVE